jgi:hypothetical protein
MSMSGGSSAADQPASFFQFPNLESICEKSDLPHRRATRLIDIGDFSELWAVDFEAGVCSSDCPRQCGQQVCRRLHGTARRHANQTR